MTPHQLEQLRQVLTAGKFEADKDKAEYPFQRGWNAGIEYAEAHLELILKPKEESRDA